MYHIAVQEKNTGGCGGGVGLSFHFFSLELRKELHKVHIVRAKSLTALEAQGF